MKSLLKTLLSATILFSLTACSTCKSTNEPHKKKCPSCITMTNHKLTNGQKIILTQKFERLLELSKDERSEEVINCPIFKHMSIDEQKVAMEKSILLQPMTPNDKAVALEKFEDMLNLSPEKRKEAYKTIIMGN